MITPPALGTVALGTGLGLSPMGWVAVAVCVTVAVTLIFAAMRKSRSSA